MAEIPAYYARGGATAADSKAMRVRRSRRRASVVRYLPGTLVRAAAPCPLTGLADAPERC